MSIWDKLKGELIDIVEWLDDSNDTLVYRFERFGNEIKNEAQMVVREGQTAVFIDKGQLADAFGPGMYTLNTDNLPILSTIQGWKYGFESPFKAEVYFGSTRQFTNLKWGTPGPSTMRDPEFGAVRVTAFGLYSIRISDLGLFIQEVAGTDDRFTVDEINENLRGKIGTRIKEIMPELGIPVIDLESKVVVLGEMLRDRLTESFSGLGLEITEVQVQDLGLPEEVETAIDKAGAIRAIGNLQNLTQYETARSIKDAAKNPGGLAGAGVGMGMGLAMGQQASQAMNQQQPQAKPAAPAGAAPPPIPGQKPFYLALDGQQAGPFNLAALKEKVAAGQLTRETLAWAEGMSEWQPAGQVEELAKLFSAVPPPIPGS